MLKKQSFRMQELATNVHLSLDLAILLFFNQVDRIRRSGLGVPEVVVKSALQVKWTPKVSLPDGIVSQVAY